MMFRVIAIVSAGLALAACSSNAEWLNLDSLKPGPTMDTVRFESEPAGAEAKISNGQTCRTPCALAVPQPDKGNLTVTFSLDGYQPDTEQIELISQGDNTSKLRPNPVVVQLTAAAPPPKPKAKKKSVKKKSTAPKPAAKPAPATTAQPSIAAPEPATPAPSATATPSAPAPSPWPSTPAQPAK